MLSSGSLIGRGYRPEAAAGLIAVWPAEPGRGIARERKRGSSYGLRVPETLRQQFLDAAVLRVEKVTPRRVRVRAWIGRNLRPVDSRWLEPGERGVLLPSPPVAEPWEPEPPESDVV
jgi:hypothetical protein